MKDEQNYLKRFSKHISLSSFGAEGQKKLAQSKVLVVGAGGLGCPALSYLASAGLLEIVIVDGDKVEESNLHRQPLFSENDIGKHKAETAKVKLESHCTFTNIKAVNSYASARNIKELSTGIDLIIDGTDNFSSKYLLNDASVQLKIPFLSSSLLHYSLQIGLFNTKSSASYRCLFPSPPKNARNCSEAGILGPVAGVAGTILALEALKYLGEVTPNLQNKLLIFNLLDYQQNILELTRDEELIKNTKLKSQQYYDSFKTCSTLNISKKISHTRLKELEAGSYTLIDVREIDEHKAFNLGGKCLPLGKITNDESLMFISSELKKDKPIILYCQKGTRSEEALSSLLEVKKMNKVIGSRVFSLIGGVEGLGIKNGTVHET